MKYIIVDDETIAHDIIRKYADLVPSLEFRMDCYDAIEAIEFLRQQEVDLIFLDLNMPKLKGFEFLRTLSNPPKVIVSTAYKEHALESYELDVVDYLLKPYSFERFLKAVNKAIDKEETSPVMSTIPAREDRIFISANKKHYQIALEDLLYVEAAGNYTKLVLASETISVREKLSTIAEKLNNEKFIQVHRSFIVNTKQISRIEGNQILIKDTAVPIGKSYKKQLERFLKL